MADLPDEWQINGFDDETAEWWIENGFDCTTAMKWRDANWYSFDPATAKQWVDADVPVEDATEWMQAIEATRFDVVDALRLPAQPERRQPTPSLKAGGSMQRSSALGRGTLRRTTMARSSSCPHS